MSEPISLFYVRDNSRDLAFSALPTAPVRGESPARVTARRVTSLVTRRAEPRRDRRTSSERGRRAA